MKLEIGKEYMTRDGFKVKVYDIARFGDYPVIAGLIFDGNVFSLKEYTIDGRYNDHGSPLDIVGEWHEPLDFDWACLPAWNNKYVAMEEDGTWHGYSDEPRNSNKYWACSSTFSLIPKDYAPKNFKGSWENSLFKNPNLPCEQ